VNSASCESAQMKSAATFLRDQEGDVLKLVAIDEPHGPSFDRDCDIPVVCPADGGLWRRAASGHRDSGCRLMNRLTYSS